MELCGTLHIYVPEKTPRRGVQTRGKKYLLSLISNAAITHYLPQVVVCIVSDGRKKIHPRVLDCLTLLGVYQPGGHMKNMVNNKEVTAHLFEYTTSFALDPNLHFKYPDKGIVPTQILFCLKEKNQKKINSHRWFFNAFAPLLQVCDHTGLCLMNIQFTYGMTAECMRPLGCRYMSGKQQYIPSLEGIRCEFKCRGSLW